MDKCSDPPKLSFGSIGKQHQSMNAIKATLVPTRRMKSSIDLEKKWDLDNQYNDINILPALPQEVDCLSQRRDPPMVS